MKTCTTLTAGICDRGMRFFGAMLMVALMIPATAMSQSSPAPVNLGTAGDFVILAKTAISTTGTTAITGDIGVSPAAATFITGFGLIADLSNTFSTSSLLTGRAYAANYTAPTPAKMTTAVGDMQTAYTNAAGRTSPDYTELYTGDLTGKMRDEILNGGIFDTILEARVITERWRKTYNTVRPHSSLGYRPPAPEVWYPLSLPMATN